MWFCCKRRSARLVVCPALPRKRESSAFALDDLQALSACLCGHDVVKGVDAFDGAACGR